MSSARTRKGTAAAVLCFGMENPVGFTTETCRDRRSARALAKSCWKTLSGLPHSPARCTSSPLGLYNI